jgi:hypothetical protein
MNNITEPIILSRGSHNAGTGRGCAMNVISWENGDTIITDYPACSDRMLSNLVQGVNDRLAGGNGFLNAADSIIALDLGHATVGTSEHNLTDEQLGVVYTRCAVLAARKVMHLDKTGTAEPAILAAEAWADCPCEKHAASAASAAYAAYAAYAASATSASYIDLAWEIITLFKELTGTASPVPDAEVIACAVEKMRTLTPAR